MNIDVIFLHTVSEPWVKHPIYTRESAGPAQKGRKVALQWNSGPSDGPQ